MPAQTGTFPSLHYEDSPAQPADLKAGGPMRSGRRRFASRGPGTPGAPSTPLHRSHLVGAIGTSFEDTNQATPNNQRKEAFFTPGSALHSQNFDGSPQFKRPLPASSTRRNSLSGSAHNQQHQKPYARPANTPKFKKKIKADAADDTDGVGKHSWLGGLISTIAQPLKSFFSFISTSPEKQKSSADTKDSEDIVETGNADEMLFIDARDNAVNEDVMHDGHEDFAQNNSSNEQSALEQQNMLLFGKRRHSIFDEEPKVYRDSFRPMTPSSNSPFRFTAAPSFDSSLKQPMKKQRIGMDLDDVESSQKRAQSILDSFTVDPIVADIISKAYGSSYSDSTKSSGNTFMMNNLVQKKIVKDAATETEPVKPLKRSGVFGLFSDDETMAENVIETRPIMETATTQNVHIAQKSAWKEPSPSELQPLPKSSQLPSTTLSLNKSKTKSTSTSPIKFEGEEKPPAMAETQESSENGTSATFAFTATSDNIASSVTSHISKQSEEREKKPQPFAFTVPKPALLEVSPERKRSAPEHEKSTDSQPAKVSETSNGFLFKTPNAVKPATVSENTFKPVTTAAFGSGSAFTFSPPTSTSSTAEPKSASPFQFKPVEMIKPNDKPSSDNRDTENAAMKSPPKPTFSFGASQATTSSATFSAPSQVPSEPEKKTDTPAPTFSFAPQAPSESDKKAESTPSTTGFGSSPVFSFGVNPSASGTSLSKPIEFGPTSATETSSGKPSFTFGVVNGSNSKPATPPQTQPVFSFGSSVEKKNPDSSVSSSGFPSFGSASAETKPSAPTTSGFAFGTSSASNLLGLAQLTKTEPAVAETSGGNSMESETATSVSAPSPFGRGDTQKTSSGPSFTFGSDLSSTPAISFGATSPTTTAAPSFSFGTPSGQPPTIVAPTFSFGSSAPTTQAPSQPAGSSSTFSGVSTGFGASSSTPVFGTSTVATDASKPPSGGFTFGQSSSTTTAPPTASPMFGSQSAPFGGFSAPAPQTSTFTFGQQPAQSQVNTPPFSFGSQQTAPEAMPTFSFGSSATTSDTSAQPFGGFGSANSSNSNLPASSSQSFTFNSGAVPQPAQNGAPSFSLGSAAQTAPGGTGRAIAQPRRRRR